MPDKQGEYIRTESEDGNTTEELHGMEVEPTGGQDSLYTKPERGLQALDEGKGT